MERRRVQLIASMLIVLSLSSCGGASGQRLAFTTIEQGEVLRLGSDMTSQDDIYIIADSKEVDFFARNILRVEPAIDDQRERAADHLRQQDYTTTFAILILREQLGGGGSAITVQQVVRADQRVIVRAKYSDPWPGQGRTAAITEPYHMIAVEKQGEWGVPIRFELTIGGKVVAATTHRIP
jgi:hypothetical protein